MGDGKELLKMEIGPKRFGFFKEKSFFIIFFIFFAF